MFKIGFWTGLFGTMFEFYGGVFRLTFFLPFTLLQVCHWEEFFLGIYLRNVNRLGTYQEVNLSKASRKIQSQLKNITQKVL